jgi:hypothetical protein
METVVEQAGMTAGEAQHGSCDFFVSCKYL